MTKELILDKFEGGYILFIAEHPEKKISIENFIIKGEDVYNTFYKNVEQPVEYKINSKLSTEYKVITNQISDLFKKIYDQIKLVSDGLTE